jgi:hypothetical protein
MTTITYTSTYDGTVSPLHAERRDAVSACRQAATVVVHLQSQSVRGKENDRLLQVLWRDITGDTITYLPPAPHTGFRTITKPWAMWW